VYRCRLGLGDFPTKEKINNNMARPTTKARQLYKSKQTGYIYAVSYRVPVKLGGNGLPQYEFEMVTLCFQGKSPDDEDTIVTTGRDFLESFEPYNPIKADTHTKTQPEK